MRLVQTDQETLYVLVHQAVKSLGGSASYGEIIDAVQRELPDALEGSIRAHILLLSVNQPSRIYYSQNQKPRKATDSRYDVLFSTGRGQVELYEPDRHGLWGIRQDRDATVVVDPNGDPVRPDERHDRRAWIFQGNPHIYDVREAVKELDFDHWTVSQHQREIQKGHRVYFWEAGSTGGIVGVGETTETPRPRASTSNRFVKDRDALSGTKTRVRIQILHSLDPILSKEEIKKVPELSKLSILKFANSTNFDVTPEQDASIWELVLPRISRGSSDPLIPKWTNAWWVNQRTFEEERSGGYVWAPNTTKGGGPAPKHWQALAGMQFGDVIFHYNRQSIRALSRVTAPAEVVDRPTGLSPSEWYGRGWKLTTHYHLLDEPIALTEIPSDWRLAEGGPFDVNAGVKQQYANHLSETFVQLMIDKFGDRLRSGGQSLDTDNGGTQLRATLIELIKRRMNVVFYGPPGTGKTFAALQVAQQWEGKEGPNTVRKITFHPSYGYEDFVQGFRPKKDEPGEFSLQPGILLRICDEARRNPGRRYLLLIDEINRGDVARIFGELITYIEFDKRGVAFDLAQDPTTQYIIPHNVYFLGTMNTADKSVSLLDVALRRRFAFVEFRADPDAFATVKGWRDSVDDIGLGKLLTALNERLLAEGVEIDRAIGQALLAVARDAEDPLGGLRERLEYDVAPLVSEYSYLDRGRISRVLPGLVDDHGRFLTGLSDADLLSAVRALISSTTVSAMASASVMEIQPALETEAVQAAFDE